MQTIPLLFAIVKLAGAAYLVWIVLKFAMYLNHL